ncbi:MEG10-like protein [Mya arenaria]|uniref:MEG10-like protein n=1 Tax=Mya arenaria TaxID=6604 RepID=A0ABY7EIH7_MYAAR|nr:MEG10-like protein [Mya arenaria]
MDLLNCGENATELRDCVNPAYVNITTPLMGLPIRRIKCSGEFQYCGFHSHDVLLKCEAAQDRSYLQLHMGLVSCHCILEEYPAMAMKSHWTNVTTKQLKTRLVITKELLVLYAKGYGISLPQSSSNIQRQSLQCFGGETNVLECTSETVQCLRVGWRGVCESWPQSVLGLYCNDYNIENVLLISLFPYGGAFEVLVDSEWGSPSAELGLIEAQIICKHFGFVNAQNTIKLSEPYQHFKTKLNGVLRCKGNESSPFECAFKHQGYLGVTDVGFTLVNCSRECRQGRYGFGRCDKDCLCISANTIICDHVSGECTCTSGWAGSYCETDINECLTQNICPDGMDCVNQNGSYECTCRPGTMVSDDLSRLPKTVFRLELRFKLPM